MTRKKLPVDLDKATVPTVRRGIAGELDAKGRFTAVDALLEPQPRQVIRGEIVRTDLVPPVGWVPVTDPTTPVFNHLDTLWRALGGKPEAGPEWRLRGSWPAMLAASRAATAASRTHFLVTMAGAR